MRNDAIRRLYPEAETIRGAIAFTAPDESGIESIIHLDDTLIQQEIMKIQLEDGIKSVSRIVQHHLDTTAKEWGYDTIYTAVGYIGDPDPAFNSEAIMFRNWRSAVWVYVNAEQTKLQNAQRTMPTDAELIAELPSLDTYK